MVLGGFHRDLEVFGGFQEGSGGAGTMEAGENSGPLRKVCSMSKEVNVSK